CARQGDYNWYFGVW
nr:immunoglobulin heavy chain junction region [Mus musculus]